MTVPTPIVPLENICSVMHNNTLYTYSAAAFQSLAMEEGAEWEQLPSGNQVEGGVCLGSVPKDDSDAGFYVVGGTSSDPEYGGLQKFSYITGEWEEVMLAAEVTKNRRWHGATYINSTDSILVYGGTQNGIMEPSSQTFAIHLGPDVNHTIESFSSIAPPTIDPMLLPWSETHAVLIGGADDNDMVMLFSAEDGWVDSGASLAEPIPKGMMTTLEGGDDSCLNLYTFDMSTSPNTVNRTVLLDGEGNPVPNSKPIQKRQLTLDHWPSYNDSLASTETRGNYAVAKDPSGLVVIAGGNEDDVLCMFHATMNEWWNASAVFAPTLLSAQSVPSDEDEPPSPQPSTPADNENTDATSSDETGSDGATASSSDDDSGLAPNVLLGVVLGSILGAAVILIAVLFLLRRRKQRLAYVEAGHARRSSGIPPLEKEDFATYEKDFKLPGGTAANHKSEGSYSSMAILMGKITGSDKTAPTSVPVKRKSSLNNGRESDNARRNSTGSTRALNPGPRPPVPQAPAPGMTRDEAGVSFAADTNRRPPRTMQTGQAALDPNSNARRSSGWNRYWSGGSSLNILGLNSKRTTVASVSSSRYSDPNRPLTQVSATVPALRIDPESMPPPVLGLQRVNSGSPTVSQHDGKIPLAEGMVGQIERPASNASASEYSSGIPASVQDSWDPTAPQRPWGSDRAPSSVYDQSSVYTTTQPGFPRPGGTNHRRLDSSSDMGWLNLGTPPPK